MKSLSWLVGFSSTVAQKRLNGPLLVHGMTLSPSSSNFTTATDGYRFVALYDEEDEKVASTGTLPPVIKLFWDVYIDGVNHKCTALGLLSVVLPKPVKVLHPRITSYDQANSGVDMGVILYVS